MTGQSRVLHPGAHPVLTLKWKLKKKPLVKPELSSWLTEFPLLWCSESSTSWPANMAKNLEQLPLADACYLSAALVVGPDFTQQLICLYMYLLLVLPLWRALTNPHPEFF